MVTGKWLAEGASPVRHSGVSDFRKLKVWQKAHSMALSAHRAATRMRGPHHGAIRNQIIRSAMSVPASIVDGRGQRSESGFARHLRIARGSASELEYHLLAARDTGAISAAEHIALHSQVTEVRMMLHGLTRRVERTSHVPGPVKPGTSVNRKPVHG